MSVTPPAQGRAAPIHVVPDRVGGWQVQREGVDQPLSAHNSATDAESAAVSEARATGRCDIVVHDRYDRIHQPR